MTIEQYNKLRGCTLHAHGSEPRNVKFVSRGRQTAKVASIIGTGEIFMRTVPVMDVIVDGKRLDYKTRFQLTNPKNPF